MSIGTQDYYSILEVDRKSTYDQIKNAYRKLAIKYHPDKNKNNQAAEEKFKNISEAYDILSDENKRAEYDRRLNYHGEKTSVFWSDFVHQKKDRRNYRGPKGQDLHVKIDLSLNEIYHGTKKTIKYNRYVKCDDCSGLGAEDLQVDQCGICNGTGIIQQKINNSTIVAYHTTPCVSCDGIGTFFKNKCMTCQGDGRIGHKSTINITIPKGIKGNSTSKMSSGGHCGKNLGQYGNLIVTYIETPHEKFSRHGDDLHYELEINPSMALMGGSVFIDTMIDKQKILIPKGTRHGDKIKIQDFGMPKIDTDEYGSLIINIQIKIPQHLTREQQDILYKLRDLGL